MGLRWFKITSLFVCLPILISNGYAQDEDSQKHIEVSFRMIGHQILLNAGDSTSRVLPIVKHGEQYRIQFESDFEFNPDKMVNSVNQIMSKTKIAKGYIMEVVECETENVVYSYEIGDLEHIDIIPCKSRNQPKSCYSLLFTLSTNDAALSLTGNGYLITFIVVIILALLFIFWRRKSKSARDPNLISLGKYLFDKRNAELIIAEQRIELSSKEADLLLLLFTTVNTTVERDVILNKVWGDEGDYVGRTLDVFISKLRKKLEGDPSVKIVNVRGVGYKLVLDV